MLDESRRCIARRNEVQLVAVPAVNIPKLGRGDLLVVRRFLGRVLPFANDDRSVCLVQVFPPQADNLAKAHCGRHRKECEINHRNRLPGIRRPMRN